MKRDIDPTEELLLRWAESMRHGGGLQEPSKASGGFIDSWVKDSEELFEAADDREIGRINAAIDSLRSPHQKIIYKKHKLGYMVWRFDNEEELYDSAKKEFVLKYFSA